MPNIRDITATSRASRRVLAELKYPVDIDWAITELLAIPTKSGNNGVLILHPAQDTFCALPYELKAIRSTATTGALKPVLCDFCYTWLPGTRTAVIAFVNKALGSHSFYCCAKLNCSANVRGLTDESLVSRTQLREDMTDEQRIERLKLKLIKICELVPAAV